MAAVRLGKEVHENSTYFNNRSQTTTYFNKDIALPDLAHGVYVVQLQTEKELLSGKFVK